MPVDNFNSISKQRNFRRVVLAQLITHLPTKIKSLKLLKQVHLRNYIDFVMSNKTCFNLLEYKTYVHWHQTVSKVMFHVNVLHT